MINKYVVTEDIEAVVGRERLVPTVTMWNRLEGRPRRTEFSRALAAEVRDPLWLLTRQWQMGEFDGEDAGSPVLAKVAWTSDAVTAVHGRNGTALPYSSDQPLEALVEAFPVRLTQGCQGGGEGGRLRSADLRLALGRRWKKLLDAGGHAARIADFLAAYPFVAPDPSDEADYEIAAHAGAWQTLAALAGRSIDGGALFLHLSAPGAAASDGLGFSEPEKSDIDALGTQFLAWARTLYFQRPAGFDTWSARHLEYGVGLSAPREEAPGALAAPEYRGGRLDWYAFDAVAAGTDHEPGTAQAPVVTSFLPATAQFEGMPNTRHWTFEEGLTSFGDIDPDTTDLAKLLLIEFGLVFANDWFLLPIELRVGTLTSVAGLAVTNVFGERFWIEPAVSAQGPVESWQMYRLTGHGAADDRLFLADTAPAVLESAPVEAVAFVRDEVSNMVWGIEMVVPLPDGSARRGREAALELHAKYQSAVPLPAPAPIENDATIRYRLMTSVAENWIPFVPVHVDGDNREIQLQRAAMPRLLEGTSGVTPQKVAARTWIVREGLDSEPPSPYYVAEEEVERAGTIVETRWRRCRWRDGSVVLWLGRRRSTGRGEAASGLAFDRIVPRKP